VGIIKNINLDRPKDSSSPGFETMLFNVENFTKHFQHVLHYCNVGNFKVISVAVLHNP